MFFIHRSVLYVILSDKSIFIHYFVRIIQNDGYKSTIFVFISIIMFNNFDGVKEDAYVTASAYCYGEGFKMKVFG